MPKQTVAPVVVSVEAQALALLQAMTPEQLQALRNGMKAVDIKLPSPAKAEKAVVAYRIQKVDSKPLARVTRKAGERYPLTENALMNTLTTWIKKDADTRIPLVKASILAGHTESFTNFDIVGIKA